MTGEQAESNIECQTCFGMGVWIVDAKGPLDIYETAEKPCETCEGSGRVFVTVRPAPSASGLSR